MNKPLDFWVKWSATLVSLLLVICNSYDIMPYDRWLGLLAAGLWLWVGVLWREPAMWIPNTIFAMIYIMGFIK
jgi:hypothetical protein